MKGSYDFSGWATKNNIRCSDGRTIMRDAFKENDGQTVPLVWNHRHDAPHNVLGHALLENRDNGVYAYCTFNETESGKMAKELVSHGDITALSIYANQLKQNAGNVIHGAIREVSLVHAGANPGAFIDSVLSHGEWSDEEAIIYTGEEFMMHSAEGKEPEEKDDGKENKSMNEEAKETTEKKGDEETVQDVYNTLTDKQKKVVNALVGMALEEGNGKTEGGNEDMKHNVFDNDEQVYTGEVISHSEMTAVISDMKRYGTMKESALAHGIENIDYLFPDAKNVTNEPIFIQRDQNWVSKVMGSVHHTPWSRIKSIFANITEDEARAKGYIKGKFKKEEFFSLLKRVTQPTTVYKKQKFDRDDIIDITDFDVISMVKGEMRLMLNEELARAYLIGDGRLASDDDKINENNIRPVASDADLFTIKVQVKLPNGCTDDERAKQFIHDIIKARKDYKGSGNPTLFTTEDMLTDCLLLTNGIGEDLYKDEAQLAKKLRVKEIVTVPVMEGAKGVNGGDLLGIIVNLSDYNVGADKGGAVSMFDDFDIDYNQQKYLIETRCSGALTKPYSAMAIEAIEATA